MKSYSNISGSDSLSDKLSDICCYFIFYSIVKDVLRADEVYAELYPRERPKDFDRNYVLEKEKEFKEIMALENPYHSIYYSNKK